MIENLGAPEIAGGGVVGLAVLYKIYRIFKEDRTGDTDRSSMEGFRADLLTMTKELQARADDFASQRNALIEENSRLRVEHGNALLALREEFQQQIHDLTDKLNEAVAEVNRLQDKLAAYEGRQNPDIGIDPITPSV